MLIRKKIGRQIDCLQDADDLTLQKNRDANYIMGLHPGHFINTGMKSLIFFHVLKRQCFIVLDNPASNALSRFEAVTPDLFRAGSSRHLEFQLLGFGVD